MRLALIGWGRQYFSAPDLHNLDDLAQRTGNAEIQRLCLHLQQALYGQQTETGNALKNDINRLLTLVTELRSLRNRSLATAAKEQEYTLPPLYKA